MIVHIGACPSRACLPMNLPNGSGLCNLSEVFYLFMTNTNIGGDFHSKSQSSLQMKRKMKKSQFCVYTSVIGNYEKLNEQLVVNESNIDFICFTDDKYLTSSTWKIVHVNPVFPLDLIRSARTIKICTHRFLPNYDISLYIDNSVKLKVIPERIFEDFLDGDYDLVCMKHSFRETVLNEFEEVLRLRYDKEDIILEQLNAYNLINPEILSQKPYWAGFMVRKHNKKIVIDSMEDWLAQVLRYSRRDQLSINYIICKYGLNIKGLSLDNNSTIYHQWPTADRYGQSSITSDLISSTDNNLRARSIDKYGSILTENFHDSEELLSTQTANSDQTIHTLITKLLKLGQSEQALSAKVLEKEEKIKSLKLQVSDRTQQLERINQALNEILVSKAWKFGLLLRNIRVKLFPPGSWREWSLGIVYRKLRSWLNKGLHLSLVI